VAQAQHQAAMNRDEHMRRESEMREREMIRERDAHYRESIMRSRDMRGGHPQPGSGPGPGPDQRPPTSDWTSGVRHHQDRSGGWQR
jgi:hypothetical protein